MSKPAKSSKPLKVPRFRTEAEEALWWHEHQNGLAEEFERAAGSGKLRRGSLARRGLTPTTTIRLDPHDIARARALAKRKGLRYQTYLKMLLHQALAYEEESA